MEQSEEKSSAKFQSGNKQKKSVRLITKNESAVGRTIS